MYIQVAEVRHTLLDPVGRITTTSVHTLNTVTTTAIIPHLTDVHIGMVGQSLAHEGETGKALRVDLHQRPEETQIVHHGTLCRSLNVLHMRKCIYYTLCWCVSIHILGDETMPTKVNVNW